jgi:hypothetical protein
MRLAQLLGLARSRALLVGLAVAFDPTFVIIGISPLSDSLFALACLSVAFFLVKARAERYALMPVVGLCVTLVLAVLVKPSALLLWVIPCIALLRAKRLMVAAIVAGIALVPVVGWTARNYAEAGVPTYSSVVAFNLLFYRAAGTQARAEEEDFNRVVRPEIEREMARRLHYATVKPITYYALPQSSRVEREKLSLALHIIGQHPIHYLGAIPIGLKRLYIELPFLPSRTWKLPATAWYVLLFAAAVFKWPTIRRANRFFAWLIVAFLAYFSLTTVLTITSGFGGTRLALPFLPLLFIAAAWDRRQRPEGTRVLPRSLPGLDRRRGPSDVHGRARSAVTSQPHGRMSWWRASYGKQREHSPGTGTPELRSGCLVRASSRCKAEQTSWFASRPTLVARGGAMPSTRCGGATLQLLRSCNDLIAWHASLVSPLRAIFASRVRTSA